MTAQTTSKKYLRITEILYPFSGLNHVDEIVLENAAIRGTKVHSICEGIMSGLGEWTCDPALEGYVESFMHWWKKGHEIVLMEKRFHCDDLMITGKLDMLIRNERGLCLCDLKTSSQPSRTWMVQGSGYIYLLQKAGYDVNQIHFIHLNKYGKPAKIYEYQPDISFFKKCVDVYKYFFNTSK